MASYITLKTVPALPEADLPDNAVVVDAGVIKQKDTTALDLDNVPDSPTFVKDTVRTKADNADTDLGNMLSERGATPKVKASKIHTDDGVSALLASDGKITSAVKTESGNNLSDVADNAEADLNEIVAGARGAASGIKAAKIRNAANTAALIDETDQISTDLKTGAGKALSTVADNADADLEIIVKGTRGAATGIKSSKVVTDDDYALPMFTQSGGLTEDVKTLGGNPVSDSADRAATGLDGEGKVQKDVPLARAAAEILAVDTATGKVDTDVSNKDGSYQFTNQGGTVAGDMTIEGDLTVLGTEFVANVETVEIEDNILLINDGETGAGVTAGQAGIIVDRGTETDYLFIFDESTDAFLVGESGNLQATATRQDTPTAKGVTFWNDTAYRLDTASDFVYKSGKLGVGQADPISTAEIGGRLMVTGTDTPASGVGVFAAYATGVGYIGVYDYGASAHKPLTIEGETLSVNIDGTVRLTVDSTGQLVIGTGDPNQLLTVEGSIALKEQAAANGNTAAYGQLWVKDDTPNTLYFTDDAGNDRQFVYAGGAFHDGFSDFVTNEHINHADVSITAGSGLTGGGTIAATRTLNVGAGAGITVNADDVALTTPGTLTSSSTNSSTDNHTHEITNYALSGTANQVTVTGVGKLLGAAVTLSLPQNIHTGASPTFANLTLSTGGALRTGTTAANTLLLQAYDVDGVAYTTFATLTAGNTPTFDLTTSATVGGSAIAYAGGAFHDGFSDFVTNEHIDHSAVSISPGDGLTGGGPITATQTLTLGDPSTLTVSTTNNVTTTSHTHAVTASSNPGAAASLLKTDSSGFLQLQKLVSPEVEASGNITLDAVNAAANSTVYVLNSNATYKADLDVENNIIVDGTVDGVDIAGFNAVSFITVSTNANVANERVLTGTNNQVAVADGGAGGNITLSTPQDIHTSATPQFAQLGLGAASTNEVLDITGRVYLTDATAPTTTTNRLYSVSGNLYWNGIGLTTGGSLPSPTAGYTLRGVDDSSWQATSDLFVDSDGKVGIGTAIPNQLLTIEGALSIKEQAAANADTAAYGQIWVKSDVPNNLYFTDDAGNDRQIVYVGGAFHDGFSDFVTNEHINHADVSITAGDGLTGGGTIAATRTLTLGTPSTLTSGTLNVVTASSHTHAITNFALSGTTNQVTVTGAGKLLGAAVTLSLPQDIHTGASPTFANLTLSTGGALRTGTTAANTLLLQAYDVDGVAYTTFATLTAGNTPTFDLSTAVTVNSNAIAYAGGAFHDEFSDFVADEHIGHSTITLTAGTGLSGGGTIDASRSFAVDLNELTTETSIAAGDYLAMVDITDNGSGKITFANIESALNHDSLSGFVTNEHIDHSSVSITGGDGLTGGGAITASQTITLGNPTTLTATTSNGVTTTSHTHAITASSNPGAAVSLLKTDASGFLQLQKLLSPEIESAGNITLDAVNAAANSTIYVLNSNATYKADLDVENNIIVDGTVDGVDIAGFNAISFVTLSTSSYTGNERVLTGTANQITVTDGGAGNNVTLSTPQNIHTGAAPTFAGLTLTGDITATTAGGLDINLGTAAGDDFTIDTSTFVVEGDTGNVGIGTTSPGQLLHIQSPDSSTNAYIEFEDDTGTYNTYIGLARSGLAQAGTLYIQTNSNNDIRFRAYANSDNTARMVIKPSGNVGIGTTSPESPLSVQKNQDNSTNISLINQDTGISARSSIRLFNDTSNLSTFASTAGIILGNSNTTSGANANNLRLFNTISGGDIEFLTGSSEIMRITSDGKVGIGTTSPKSDFHLVSNAASTKMTIAGAGTDGNDATLELLESDGDGSEVGFQTIYDGGTNKYYIKSINSGTPTTRLTIQRDDGNVGIGTTGPTSKLDVTIPDISNSVADSESLSIVNTTAAVANVTGDDGQQYSPALRWEGQGWKTDATAASQSVEFRAFVRPIQGAANPTGSLDFQASINGVAYTDILSMNSAGYVGINTTDPGFTLEVNGTIAAVDKSFVIDHPTKDNMRLVHSSLEGPERAVYFRGELEGNDVIELPEYWTGLVHEDTITVDLTPADKYQKLYVKEIRDNRVYIGTGGLRSRSSIHCYYTVVAERKDIDKLVVEIPKQAHIEVA